MMSSDFNNNDNSTNDSSLSYFPPPSDEETATEYQMHYDDNLIYPLIPISMVSSTLSILGSTSIMVMSYRENKRRRQIMQRLLFGLSLTDFISSSCFLMMPFVAPSEEGLAAAIGNANTCTAIGWILCVFLLIGGIFNCYLSLYFFLVVRRNWREQHFTLLKEVLAYVFAVVLIVGTNIRVLTYDGVNTSSLVNNFCMMAPGPWECNYEDDDDPELCGGNYSDRPTFANYFYFIFFSVTGFVSTIMVYCRARATFQRSNAYRFERHVQQQQQSSSSPQPPSRRSSAYNIIVKSLQGGRDTSMEQTTPDASSQDDVQQQQTRPPRISARLSSSSFSSSSFSDEKTRQVATQAMFYSLAFLNSFIWPGISVILTIMVPTDPNKSGQQILHEQKENPGYYVLSVLFWFSFPLQGFLNFFVYTRVKVQEWKKADPNCSTFHIYRLILFGIPLPMPRLSESRLDNLAVQDDGQKTPYDPNRNHQKRNIGNKQESSTLRESFDNNNAAPPSSSSSKEAFEGAVVAIEDQA